MRIEDKGTVTLDSVGTAHPDQGPIKAASSYSEKVRARMREAAELKGKGKPLGGAPPIPEGKLAPLAMPKPSFGLDEPPPPISRDDRAVRPPSTPPIQGVGSAYVANQAVSRGAPLAPRKPAEPEQERPKMTPAIPTTTNPTPVKEPIGVDQETQDDLKRSEEAIAKNHQRDTAFEFPSIPDVRNSLLDEKRRKTIEDRLSPLDLADMIVSREIQQVVPVIPGKLEMTLRTYSQAEYLFCLRYVQKFSANSVAHMEEMVNTCKLACSLVALNSVPLPDHRKDRGSRNEAVDDKAFVEKLDALSAYPVQLLADISVQTMWFNDRVNKLFSAETLKNG